MRRLFAATAFALTACVAATLTLPAGAAMQDPRTDKRSAIADALPDTVLGVATRVLAGNPRPTDPSPSMALLDLRLALPQLSGSDQVRAAALLARPTDGASDPLGDGYTVPAKKKCSSYVCIHWVESTVDAPPNMAWVNESLKQLNRVWKFEIGNRGYRKPLSDGRKGGNSKLDIYLKDVGSVGYYGYCAAEKAHKRFRFTYSGYCVLDDDFDPAQFGAPALSSLKVTAAHEFFHAVQYAYDATEDRWFMESTATWMEERFADGINDNRQYLPSGQLGSPQTPLDTYTFGGLMQYGNWAWWEYLSQRKGNGIVKQVWNKAGAFKGAPDKYSTQALVIVLKSKGGFKKAFGGYASGNTVPSKTYPEGSVWPAAPISSTYTLQATSTTSGDQSTTLDHLASRNVKAISGATLAATGWSLRVSVDGPASKSAPVAVVWIKKKNGTMVRETIKLNKSGIGKGVYGFNATYVESVTVTLANASTRFSCWRSTSMYSCYGNPRDDNKNFNYKLTAFQK